MGDKVALVDASHEKFHDLWMETLEKQLKALGQNVQDSMNLLSLAEAHLIPFLFI